MPEYKLIYEPYKFDELTTKAKSKKEGGNYGEAETKEWNNALNKGLGKTIKEGWKVVNSGAIQSGPDVIFWALLEKPSSQIKEE